MQFGHDPIVEIIVPNTATQNDSAILIEGTNMPPCMSSTYTAGVFWRPKDNATGSILVDAPTFFIAVNDTAGSNTNFVDFGTSMYDPYVPFCDYAVHEQRILRNSGGVMSYEIVFGGGFPATQFTEADTLIHVVGDTQYFVSAGGSGNVQAYIPYAPDYLSSNAAVNSPLTPAFAVIPNTLINQTVLRTTDQFIVHGTFDIMQAIAGANVGICLLIVDGVALAQQANFRPGAVGSRAPATRFWKVTGLTPGVHTFQLAVSATLLNSFTVNPVHTSILIDPRF